jgi:hypothetical protein
MSIPRVNSSASELNDFTESEGKKIYHVRVIFSVRVLDSFSFLGLQIATDSVNQLGPGYESLPSAHFNSADFRCTYPNIIFALRSSFRLSCTYLLLNNFQYQLGFLGFFH